MRPLIYKTVETKWSEDIMLPTWNLFLEETDPPQLFDTLYLFLLGWLYSYHVAASMNTALSLLPAKTLSKLGP